MKAKLERILWKNGNHLNTHGKEVNPKQIGETHIAYLNYPFIENEIFEKAKKISLNLDINDSSEINSYMIGTGAEGCYSLAIEPGLIYVSLGFYKI
jgi:hypothetical protein